MSEKISCPSCGGGGGGGGGPQLKLTKSGTGEKTRKKQSRAICANVTRDASV